MGNEKKKERDSFHFISLFREVVYEDTHKNGTTVAMLMGVIK